MWTMEVQRHGVAELCVMAPHVVTDADSVQDALTDDLPDESTQQGYHRSVSYILCHCGERFTGKGLARSDFDEHMSEVKQRHVITDVERHPVHGTPDEISYHITFALDDETHEMLCAHTDDGPQVSHIESLDASSEMDEMVMETMARTFVYNTEEYFTE